MENQRMQILTAREQAEADPLRYAQGLAAAYTVAAKHSAELARRRDLLRIGMSNIPDGACFKDSHCRFTRVHSADAKFLAPGDVSAALGRTDFDSFPPAEALNHSAGKQRLLKPAGP